MSEKKNNNFSKYLNMNTLKGVLKRLFFHNGLLKLIAILISVVLWAGLISQDENLTRDKTFQNVNVTVSGAEALKNSGFIVVSDLDEMLDNVSFVAAVPQKQYENADVSVYNIRLDLSRIKATGEQEIKLQSTNSALFGKVTSINPSSIKVNVEDSRFRVRGRGNSRRMVPEDL